MSGHFICEYCGYDGGEHAEGCRDFQPMPPCELFIHIAPKKDSCAHVWDGEQSIEHDGIVTGSTSVCSKCGMTAFEHSLRYSE
jgi:hypothetical protein